MYGTEAGYRAYHTARGRDVAGQLNTTVLAKLLVASEWLDGKYRDRFMGTKVGQQAQEREWPRVGVVDCDGYAVSSETVPQAIEYATYEVAYREITAPGTLSRDFTASKYSKVAISGSIDVTFRDQGAGDVQTQFPIVDQILGSLLGGCSAVSALSGKVVRA